MLGFGCSFDDPQEKKEIDPTIMSDRIRVFFIFIVVDGYIDPKLSEFKRINRSNE